MYYVFLRYSLILALHCTFEMTASCFHNPNDVQESVTVSIAKPCLSKEFIATSYVVDGGGASGYLYQCVNMRKKERKFNPKEDVIFTVTGDARIDMLWKDDETLIITYLRGVNIYKKEKTWGGEKKIKIFYVEK